MNISTMHSIEQFLSLMKNLNIKLWVEGNDLRFKAPKGALTQDLRQELKRRKLELIQFIRENKASESNFSIVPVLRNRA